MRVEPLRLPFDLSVRMPGSKSIANRALVAACLADGTTRIHGATLCDDVLLLAQNLIRMGYRLRVDDDVIEVRGGVPTAARADTITLDCGLGGTTLRFLVAVAAVTPGTFVLTGAPRLLERPIDDLVDALRALGADIESEAGHPPLRVRGRSLVGGDVEVGTERSSQFLTALLLVAPTFEDGLTVARRGTLASPGYVDMTCRVLEAFGVRVQTDGAQWTVPGVGLTAPGDFTVEGDWSAAGAWLVLAARTGSRFHAENLDPDSTQSDRAMPDLVAALADPGDVEIDASDTPDQVMNLAVLAALREGETRIRGAANLRLKESDRLAATTRELRKAGVDVEESADGLTVRGPTRLLPADFACHGDHRIAMAMAVLGSLRSGSTLDTPDCVTKSYPSFFEDLAAAHAHPRCVALVGMRGAGKSTLGRALAEALDLRFVDTDDAFLAAHGPISSFVTAHGWDAFRDREAEVVAASVAPGRVVALGGGSVDRAATAGLVADRALVVWGRERRETLAARLAAAPRPALTGLDPADEIATVLEHRDPIHARLSDLELPPNESVERRVERVRHWLAGLVAPTRTTPHG
ncbi:MAG: 3-phosphoshikimate 1-carboxyvinyltransferase [Planctomycetota bacterium]